MFLLLLISLIHAQRVNNFLPQWPFPVNLLKTNNVPPDGLKLYDQNSFRSYHMEITAANVALMTANIVNETQVTCNLITDYDTPQAVTLTDVKCSFKGSVGSLRMCVDEFKNLNGECRRLSLQVKNKKGSIPQKYIFNGMPVDLALVSERTSYYLMTTLGMYSPLAVHAKLFLNGKYLGLYSFVEPVDEIFTNTRFGKDQRLGKGGLYKDLWLNPIHTANPEKYRKGGLKEDNEFIKQVMTEMQTIPLVGDSPKEFVNKYFDVQSFINLTAFNTAIGNTDDWRQKHNFYLYIRLGKSNRKRITFIPWDYDRLYDENNNNRGALRGMPWWDISRTATPSACNQRILSSQEKAILAGGVFIEEIAWYKGIFDNLPEDIDIPVTCDKFTQIMAYAFSASIRQQTKYFISKIDIGELSQKWNEWNNQIQIALQYDIAGPNMQTLIMEQSKLRNAITSAMTKALNDISQTEAPRIGKRPLGI